MIEDYKIKIKAEGIRVLVIDNAKHPLSKEQELKTIQEVLDKIKEILINGKKK